MAEQPKSPFGDMADWKAQFDDAARRWNEMLTSMMGTEAFAAASGRYMEAYLDFHKLMSDSVEQYLQAFQLPTRSDVASLAERLAALEQQIDGIARKVDDLSRQTSTAKTPRKRAGKNGK